MGTLFSSENLVEWLHEEQVRAVRAVAEVNPIELRFDPVGISARIVEEFAVEPLALDWEAMTRDQIETVQLPASSFGEQYVVNGFSMTIHVPFTGSVRLFKMAPSTFSTAGKPDGAVYGHQLLLDVKLPHADPSAWQSAIEQLQNNLNNHVGWVNDDVATGRIQLQNAVDSAVSARKANLDMASSLSERLTIPLHATKDQGVPISVARKTVRAMEAVGSRTIPQGSGLVDPSLSEAIYEDVLATLRAVGNSFERLPQTTARFSEEELRDVLLFILNSNYQGAASGEVFNGAGKTDILVRHGDRNAFIGECKIWRGAKAFRSAIDQLLSYTVWRDTKAALILFIRSRDATDIIQKARHEVMSHAGFVRERASSESESRQDFLMRARDDESRTIRLALLPMVVRPAPSDNEQKG